MQSYRKHVIKDPTVKRMFVVCVVSTNDSVCKLSVNASIKALKDYTIWDNNIARILHQNIAMDLILLHVSVRVPYTLSILPPLRFWMNDSNSILIVPFCKEINLKYHRLMDIVIPVNPYFNHTYAEITKYWADNVKEIWARAKFTSFLFLLAG